MRGGRSFCRLDPERRCTACSSAAQRRTAWGPSNRFTDRRLQFYMGLGEDMDEFVDLFPDVDNAELREQIKLCEKHFGKQLDTEQLESFTGYCRGVPDMFGILVGCFGAGKSELSHWFAHLAAGPREFIPSRPKADFLEHSACVQTCPAQ